MRGFVLALALLASSAGGAQTIVRELPNRPITIQLDGVPTSALVVMLMRDVMRVPYVIAPDVLADRRPTSVKLVIPRDRVPERVVAYLRRVGFTVDLQGGTVYVSRNGGAAAVAAPASAGASSVPMGSPLSPAQPSGLVENSPALPGSAGHIIAAPRLAQEPAEPVEPEQMLAYIPAHRDPAFFVSVLEPLIPGVSFGGRGDVAANQERNNITSANGSDVLVMAGTPVDLERARKLVLTLDRPRPVVAVKAVIMQVSDIRARGSALSLLASFAGGDLQIGSYAEHVPASQFIRLSTGAVKAVLSAVNEDSRFKVVATPNLSALSGTVATMNSGSQVPTVGAVSIAEGGTPVQSVVYRDSGVTLTVRPIVRGDLIELDVTQERSTFVKTATGVEDSPTLQRASSTASVVIKSGESVVLAGLTEDSNGATRQGLFGGLLGVRSRDNSTSELLVVLQAELVPGVPGLTGTFVPIETEEKDDAAADKSPA